MLCIKGGKEDEGSDQYRKLGKCSVWNCVLLYVLLALRVCT